MSTGIVVSSESARKTEGEILAKHKQDYVKLYAEVAGLDDIEPFVIEDDSDLVFAHQLLLYVKKQKKTLEDRCKSVTKPLNDVLKTIREWFRDPTDGWGSLEAILKKKIGAYELLLSKKEDEAIALIAQASKEEDFDKAHAASMSLQVSRPKTAGITSTEKWVLDVDKLDLEKVPERFIIKHLNKTEVKEYIRQFGKGRPKDLPGLVFKKDIAVTGSTKG